MAELKKLDVRLWFGDNCVNISYANAKTETYIDMGITADGYVEGYICTPSGELTFDTSESPEKFHSFMRDFLGDWHAEQS